MRTTTVAELAILALLTRDVTLRLKVQNGSGTMVDYSTWLESITPDEDIDRPVSGMTFHLRRDSGSTKSLSPFRADSTLNRLDDGVTYSPALDLNRIVTFEAATVAVGSFPGATDTKLLFKGTIDTINFEQSPISIVCRDLGAPLVDRWIETKTYYGTGPGRAIALVKQDILDTEFGAGVVPVVTIGVPAFNVVTYQQQIQSVSDAEQALDALKAWDSRYWWDEGTGTFRYTFQEPPRTKTVPDYTFGPSGYYNVSALDLDLTDIRNVIQVTYRDQGTKERASVTRTDATSITKYDRRFMLIEEADDSPIDTLAEATTMADAALSDMKEPKASLEIELPFFWPCQLWDLYRFTANGVHFNTDQDLAVSSYRHELSPGKHRTFVKLRGSPAGAYVNWLGRGGTIGGGVAQPPVPVITWKNTEVDESVWRFTFSVKAGTGGGGSNISYAITSKRASAAESTLSTGTATSLPLDLDITRDPQVDKVVRFTVTDEATGLTAEDRITVPSIRDEVDSSGAPKRGKAYDDGDYTARGTGTGDVRTGVGQENGGSVKSIASGRDDSPPLSHGSTQSYPTNFQNPAKIDIVGGLSYEPTSVWGTSDPGTSGAFGALAPFAKAQVDESAAISVSVSGYTVRARLRQAGTVVGHADAFPAGAITTNGGDKQVTVATAPAFDDTYNAALTYNFSSTGGHGGLDASSVSATVSLQYWNGSSWVTLSTFTDGDSDPGTFHGGSGSCGVAGSTSLAGTQAGLTSSSLMRILLTLNAGSGARTYSVDPSFLSYSTSSSEQYACKTPTGVTVVGTAIGAS